MGKLPETRAGHYGAGLPRRIGALPHSAQRDQGSTLLYVVGEHDLAGWISDWLASDFLESFVEG